MTTVSNEITTLQNQTAFLQNTGSRESSDVTDSNMFLSLMLEQLQHQDPTEPTDNTEWLAQLAQYSSLEQMTQMNDNLKDCMGYISSLSDSSSANAQITQTLSLVGKEVTISDPDDSTKRITGDVAEASFEDGTGKVKVNGNYYSIGNIISVRDKSIN